MKNGRNGKKRSPRKDPRGKDQFTKRQREVESVDMKESTSNHMEGRPNDWRWYAQNPQLIRDAASFPFGVPVGNRLSTGIAGVDQGSVPGMMVYYFVPTAGVASDSNAPINVAMRRLYSFVRYANSGSVNYDAPDLMLYVLSTTSVYMMHSWMRRIYGLINDYTPYNRYFPESLIRAMGVDFEDIHKNINDFRAYINQVAVKLGSIWVPNSMSYVARQVWMCEGIYLDSMTEKAQSYFYTPVAFYQFQLDSQGAGSLQTKHFMSGASPMAKLLKFADIVTMIDGLINPILANEDFGIMGGDILKAFGSNGIIHMPTISEDYRIFPVYNQEVLSQMENSSPMGGSVVANVTQTTAVGTGYLVTRPSIGIGVSVGSTIEASANSLVTLGDLYVSAYNTDRLLNFHHSAPTPEEVMVATRLMTFIDGIAPTWTVADGVASTNLNVSVCGTEIIEYAMHFSFAWGTSGNVSLTGRPANRLTMYQSMASTNPNPIILAENLLVGLAGLATFDWHHQVIPVVAYVNTTTGNAAPLIYTQIKGILMDLDFTTRVSSVNVEDMNLVALLSEFTIPQIG